MMRIDSIYKMILISRVASMYIHDEEDITTIDYVLNAVMNLKKTTYE